MQLTATPAWLSLNRPERRAFAGEVRAPILAAHPAMTTRDYNAEAFSGRCSDIAVFATEDLEDYADLIDALRDWAFFAAPYYQLVDVIPAVEINYRAYEARLAAAAA
jgi:hypothetical protein